jgi:hypothetical protein
MLLLSSLAEAQSTPTPTPTPQFRIAAPIPGQKVIGVTPTIKIEYSSEPAFGLQPATLSVRVNGSDWSGRFQSATAGSAEYTVKVDDGLEAGTQALEIKASIQDGTGKTLTDEKKYDVVPILEAVSPAMGFPAEPALGVAGDFVDVGGIGLDADAPKNVLRFRGVFATADAPFMRVEDDRRKGRIEIPEGAVSGDVTLVVNDELSREKLPFEVRGPLPYCGNPLQILPMKDGRYLVWYYATFTFCPSIPENIGNYTVALLNEDGTGGVVRTSPRSGIGSIAGIAVDKSGTGFAILLRGAPGRVTIQYAGVSTDVQYVYDASPYPPYVGQAAFDFDRNGSLYFAFSNIIQVMVPGSPYPRAVAKDIKILRVGCPRAGGSQVGEVVLTMPGDTGNPLKPSRYPGMMKIHCDGTGYLSTYLNHLDGDRDLVKILSVEPSGVTVRGDFTPPGTEVLDLAPTIESKHFYGASFLWRTDPNEGGFRDFVLWKYDEGRLTELGTDPETREFWIWPRPITITQGGSVLSTYPTGPNSGFARAPVPPELRVAPRVVDGELTTLPYPCPTPAAARFAALTVTTSLSCPLDKIEILPDTTRWRPQRETAAGVKDIDVIFEGPKDLTDKTTLEITGPSGTVATPTLAFSKISDIDDSKAKWKIVWSGPWVDGNGRPLSADDYKLLVKGVKEGGSTVESKADDPNATVSLVEVKTVSKFQGYNGSIVDTNPAVGLITSRIAGQGEPTSGSLIRQPRPGGGARVFAEKTTSGTDAAGNPILSAAALDEVKLTATVFPAIPANITPGRVRVYFRSLDVDDPDGPPIDLDGDAVDPNTGKPVPVADNDGGTTSLTPGFVDIEPDKADAETVFNISHQPGDNYRVAASTSEMWLNDLKATQGTQTGDVEDPAEPDASKRKLTEADQLSEMITVWRTLNVEVDSMPPPPNGTADAERNFVEGDVVGFTRSGRRVTRLMLSPNVTNLSFGFLDRSPALSAQGQSAGNGRFEHGTIRIGSGAAAAVIAQVDGNGPDFVEKQAGIVVPYEVVDAQGGQRRAGRLIGWDATTRQFVLDRAVGRPVYNGGSITVGGTRWTIRAAQGPNVDVTESYNPAFRLEDDDPSGLPFQPGSNLMQPVDNPNMNIYAAAYIRPAYGLTSTKAPVFRRNVNVLTGTADDEVEAKRQLATGRDWPSSDVFWVAYVQGALQEDNRRDQDADVEQQAAALYGWCPQPGTHGVLVFREAARETVTFVARVGITMTEQQVYDEVVAHEIGHQFTLQDNTGGLMNQGVTIPGQPPRGHYFTGAHIRIMRSRLHP